MGQNSTKLGLMCLAQGHKAVTPVRLEPAVPGTQAKHSITEPLRSLNICFSLEHKTNIFTAKGYT